MNALIPTPVQSLARGAAEAAPDVLLTLAHTLWQGAVVAALLAVALRAAPASRAALRYGISVAALAALVVAASVTWALVGGSRAGTTAASAGADARGDVLEVSATGQLETNAASPRRAAAVAASVPGAADGAKAAAPAPTVRPALEALAGPITGLYATGVLLMLARAAVLLHAAGRLRRVGRPVNDAWLSAEVDRLRNALRIARRVRLAALERLSVPCVLGVLVPTILLPASLLTGTPPEQIRLILAHELAHVRRHDYLLNLVQLLVEALLFFNPAVWWISRQIRVEREAAADALAVRATGTPVEYATTLADFADRLLDPLRGSRASPAVGGLAPAFAGPNPPGTLLDRVRRVVAPGHRPHVRLPWPALVAALVLGSALLAGLWQTGRAVAQVAADLLTPAQRVEQITRIAKENTEPPFSESDPKATFEVTGVVRTHDGNPIPRGAYVSAHLYRQGYSSSHSLSIDNFGKFRVSLHPGPIYLAAFAKGYAPAFAGPFQLAPDKPLPPVELTLTEGFTAAIQVRDPAGKPIPGAKVVGGHTFPKNSWSYTLNAVADEAGTITLPNCGDQPATLRISAPGFQRDRKEEVTFEPGRPLAWTLRPAKTVKGVVRSRADDRPIPDARIRFIRQTGDWHDGNSFDGAPVWATTDANGAFALDELRDDATYHFMVEADEHSPEFVDSVAVTREEGDLTIALGPEIYVAGTVTGDLKKLPKRQGKPTLTYSRTLRTGNGSHSSYEYAPVRIEEGAGHFRIGQLWPGQLTINAPGKPLTLDVTATKTDVRIDLNEQAPPPQKKPRRTVVFKFQTPAGSPPPTGAIDVHAQDASDRPGYPRVEIKGGRAQVDVVAPNVIQYAPKGTVGYWFPQTYGVRVEAGSDPLEISIPVTPAGAIYGRVVEADGSPISGREIGTPSLITVKRPPPLENGASLLSELVSITSDGKFVASPVPVGGTYALLASRKQTIVLSPPLAVSEQTPIHQVDLRFSRGVTVAGQVIDSDGKPVPGVPVEFSYVNPHGGSHGFSPPPRTGPDGRFVFDDVNAEIAGSYALWVSPDRGFQPARAAVDFAGLPLTVRLQPGRPARGVVQEEGGRPVKGVTVVATLAEFRPGDVSAQYQAEAPTNDRGEFRFSTLAPGRRYSVHIGSRQLARYPTTMDADAEAPTVVVVKPDRQ